MRDWIEANYWYQDWRYCVAAMKDPIFAKSVALLSRAAMKAQANYVMFAAQIQAAKK